MVIRIFVLTSLLSLICGPASARPLEQGPFLPKFDQLDASGRKGVARSDIPTPVFRTATAGTTFFGGTYWAADSMRWEAYKDHLWTFDSGEGSSLVPAGGPQAMSLPTSNWVNPFKEPGRHATMEGWIGFDNTYSNINYFRRIGSNDSRFGSTKCVGQLGGLGGIYSFWCGVFPGEAIQLCYAGGQGYGNAWNVCIEHPFSYAGGNVTLSYLYKNETEDGFDYTHVYIDTSGNGDLDDRVEPIVYTGAVSGQETLQLSPGHELPNSPGQIKIQFCVASDGAWSDQDGLNPTICGAFAVDNIVITGGVTHTATFESGNDGWALAAPAPGLGGEWSDLKSLNDLPQPMAPCACAIQESVLVLGNDQGGHDVYQDNLVSSPWIDLKQYGFIGATGKLIKTNIYADLPLRNYIFTQFNAQWYPEKCLQTGKLVTSSWTSNGFVYYFGGTPTCTSTVPGTIGTEIDFSGFIPAGAEQVRIALGVLSYCRFFANCTGVTNTTPWFDNAGLGVYGSVNLPVIHAEDQGRAQDNFPINGCVNVLCPARIDCNDLRGDTQLAYGTLGDTLVVKGAVGEHSEVYVHFRVRPGPGVNMTKFNAWYSSHAASPIDPTFKRARCDTAEVGSSGPISGVWMTSYHELDPNFAAHGVNDRTLDSYDQGIGMWRISHDIFPDNLLTPGSRLDYFFSANEVGSSTSYLDPPTAPETPYEMEVLPSSMTSNGTSNCVLYVDHFDRGGQPLIENALGSLLGSGSANVENTKWDRFDVNGAGSGQASLGRPVGTDYGATWSQLMGYHVILWDTGDLEAFNLTEADGSVLNYWLTNSGINELYLSGNSLVHSVIADAANSPSADYLVEGLAGATTRAQCASGSFAAFGCPFVGSPQDLTPCVNLVRTPGALVAGLDRAQGHVAQGNGCPERRSFDVLDILRPDYGINRADEMYTSPVKFASYASIGTFGGIRLVTDGVSVIYRRSDGTPCDFSTGGTNAVTERLSEVLHFFEVSAGVCLPYGTGVPVDDNAPPVVTALSTISPNPLASGVPGRIQFSMAKASVARLEIIDLQGRVVRTVFDGPAERGPNEAMWDGRDAAGVFVGSGVYFYRFRALDQEQTKKLVIVGGRE